MANARYLACPNPYNDAPALVRLGASSQSPIRFSPSAYSSQSSPPVSSPPTYIQAELGERPRDPVKRKAWDRGVAQIEGYRQQHGVIDPNRALGREVKRGAGHARQQAARRRLLEHQRVLGSRPVRGASASAWALEGDWALAHRPPDD